VLANLKSEFISAADSEAAAVAAHAISL